MKKNTYWLNGLICMCLSVFMLGFASCNNEDFPEHTEVEYDLEVSAIEYFFPADGGSFTLTVGTEYPEGWDVKIDFPAGGAQEWLKEAEGRTGTEVTFQADKSELAALKNAVVTVTAGDITKTVNFAQLPYTHGSLEIHMVGYMEAVSPKGKYILNGTNDGEVITLFLYDTDTHTKVVAGELREDNPLASIYGVADDGTILLGIGSSGVDNGYILKDGVLTPMSKPAGASRVIPQDISSDGSVIAGYVYMAGSYAYKPIKWVNGEPILLNYPTETRGPQPWPEDYCAARMVSHDGNIIIGGHGQGTGDAIYWENGSLDYAYLLPEYTETEYEVPDGRGGTRPLTLPGIAEVGVGYNGKFSSNGDYLVVSCQMPWLHPMFGVWLGFNTAALFDFKNKEVVKVMNDLVDNGEMAIAAGYGATNDGDLFYRYPVPSAFQPYGYVYSSSAQQNMGGGDWIRERFGLEFPELTCVDKYDEERGVIIGYMMTFSQLYGFYMVVK